MHLQTHNPRGRGERGARGRRGDTLELYRLTDSSTHYAQRAAFYYLTHAYKRYTVFITLLKPHGGKTMNEQLNILSIDAWCDGSSWTWNDWYKIGVIQKSEFEQLKGNRALCRYMRKEGFMSAESAGHVLVNDDGYNVVFCERNGMPVFAIEYGPAY